MLHAGLRRGLEQRTRRAGVVAVVLERIRDRLRHDGVRGEVDDGVDAVLGEQLVDELAIADVADDERHVAHGLAEAGG